MSHLTKCGKIMGRRWAISVFLVSCAVLLVYRLLTGHWPYTDQILIGLYDAENFFAPVSLPFATPRVVDMAVGALLLFFLIAIGTTLNEKGWRDSDEFEATNGFWIGVCLGALASICVIGWSGVSGTVISTLIYASCISWGMLKKCRSWYPNSHDQYRMAYFHEGFGIQLAAVATLWCASTYVHGVVAGVVYALTALIVAWVVHLVVYMIRTFSISTTIDEVIRYYTQCGETECQSVAAQETA